MVTASQVKELREKTGAGMMDCKKVLTETDGDMEKAMDLLRERGITKAGKKSERIAAEGLTEGAVNGNTAIVFEVNCETDFVTKNEKFQNLIAELKHSWSVIAIPANPNSIALFIKSLGRFIESKSLRFE